MGAMKDLMRLPAKDLTSLTKPFAAPEQLPPGQSTLLTFGDVIPFCEIDFIAASSGDAASTANESIFSGLGCWTSAVCSCCRSNNITIELSVRKQNKTGIIRFDFDPKCIAVFILALQINGSSSTILARLTGWARIDPVTETQAGRSLAEESHR